MIPRHIEIVDELAIKICRDLDIPSYKWGCSMQYRAVVKKSGDWWIGWLVDIPGVNAQERTRQRLTESLRIGAEDMLNAPVDVKDEEELVKIEV